MKATRARRPKKYQVPALKRAFAILDSLNESSFGLTARDISDKHELPYSTAFYLLETMRECGYLQRDEKSKKYTVGYKLFGFRGGVAAQVSVNLRSVALPLMEELTASTGLTAHLAVLERDEAVYIEKTEPPGFIRLNTWVGKRNSLHCTAVGKALVAHLPQSELVQVCPESALQARTARTIVAMDRLLAELQDVRQEGYAVDDGEDEPEGRCVAAPIWSADDKVIASLGLSGTLLQIDLARLKALGKLVRNYANQIGQRLGRPTQSHKVGS